MKTILWLCLLGLPVSAQAEKLLTAPVAYRELALTYAADGVVEAVKQSTVAAQIGGRVTEVNFRVGDWVRQGQVIARIDETTVSQQAAGSQAQVVAARALLDNARLNFERNRQLVAQNFVSKAALDRAESEFRAAEAGYKAALAGSGQASATKGFATIMAPYSGVVSAVHVETGDTVFPGRPLMSGFDPSGLRIVANLTQTHLAALKPGELPRIEVPALKKWFQAQRQTVLPLADPRSLSVQVRLDLPADTKGLLPGMFARAYFVTGRAKKLLVPASAVIRRSEVTGVYVVAASGAVQLRQVRLGVVSPEGVEVLSGLRSGEQVAMDPVRAGLAAR